MSNPATDYYLHSIDCARHAADVACTRDCAPRRAEGDAVESAALVVAHLDAMGAPLADFLDSVKPGDLDDLAAAVGITVAQAQAAQRHLAAEGDRVSDIDRNRAYTVAVKRSEAGIVSEVTNHYGNVTVSVQGEGDHPSTRRARARAAVRSALGANWDVLEYLGVTLMTHRNPQTGGTYGSLHRYSAVKVG